MKFTHFYCYYGILAVPAAFANAVWNISLGEDWITTREAFMVAQLPGAFWIKLD